MSKNFPPRGQVAQKNFHLGLSDWGYPPSSGCQMIIGFRLDGLQCVPASNPSHCPYTWTVQLKYTYPIYKKYFYSTVTRNARYQNHFFCINVSIKYMWQSCNSWEKRTEAGRKRHSSLLSHLSGPKPLCKTKLQGSWFFLLLICIHYTIQYTFVRKFSHPYCYFGV